MIIKAKFKRTMSLDHNILNNNEIIDSIINNDDVLINISYHSYFDNKYLFIPNTKDEKSDYYFNHYIDSYYEYDDEIYCNIYIDDNIKDFLGEYFDDIFDNQNEFSFLRNAPDCTLYIEYKEE